MKVGIIKKLQAFRSFTAMGCEFVVNESPIHSIYKKHGDDLLFTDSFITVLFAFNQIVLHNKNNDRGMLFYLCFLIPFLFFIF